MAMPPKSDESVLCAKLWQCHLSYLLVGLTTVAFLGYIVGTASKKAPFVFAQDYCDASLNNATALPSGLRFPAVFTYFTSSAIPLDSYIWVSLRQALRHHRDVVLISNASAVTLAASFAGRLSLVDIVPLIASPRLAAFRRAYMPWGMKEPWEEENFSRFYIISAFMEREGLEFIFFADTDVALNAPIGPVPPLRGCDAMVTYRDQEAGFSDLFNWQVWAGTSILSRSVLADFTAFVPRMYVEPYVNILRKKRDRSPYVCDMTLWYFYVAAASSELRSRWGVAAPLPATSPRLFCSSTRYGYNVMIGDLDNGRQCPPPVSVRSIHFQGGSKDMIKSYAKFAPGQFDLELGIQTY